LVYGKSKFVKQENNDPSGVKPVISETSQSKVKAAGTFHRSRMMRAISRAKSPSLGLSRFALLEFN